MNIPIEQLVQAETALKIAKGMYGLDGINATPYLIAALTVAIVIIVYLMMDRGKCSNCAAPTHQPMIPMMPQMIPMMPQYPQIQSPLKTYYNPMPNYAAINY